MSPPSEQNRSTDGTPSTDYRRRRFLALGAGLGSVWLAGCTGEADLDPGGQNSPTAETTGSKSSNVGHFRLLISDQPVAIGDFDALIVSFDRARIFRADGDEDDEDVDTETETVTGTEPSNGTVTTTLNGTVTSTETETVEEAKEPEDEDDEDRGFFVIDLDGATVDLTEVVGDKAIGVFDGELPEGRYAKIELYAANVEGIVDGESVEVKIPSGKLQIVKPFEVVAGETLSFVFDINVVKKGQKDEYNLLPVISESGVAGEDVEVDEIGAENATSSDDDGSEADEDEDEEEEDEEDEDGQSGGPPDDAGNGQP